MHKLTLKEIKYPELKKIFVFLAYFHHNVFMIDAEQIRKQLHDTALKAPKSSGVYLWRDESGTVIYVGKAKNLKNRLSSYFSGQKDIKTRTLVAKAKSIEYITTGNEYEALILENTLIKKHNPRFNIDLKDDKSYPVLRITNEDFPRIFKTRRIIEDGSRYFGPFPNVAALDDFIENLYRLYPVRRCKRFRKRTNPCMYYHIKQCAAPCCNKISKEDYIPYIDEIIRLLEGEGESAVKKLEEEMKAAARNLQFEKAARMRDGIRGIITLHEQNNVEDFDPEGRDYIASASEGTLISFAVMRMRSGKLVARDIYRTRSINDEEDAMEEFLLAYYTEASKIPPRIFIPVRKGIVLARQYFSQQFGVNPSIAAIRETMPNAKRHMAVLEMARQNAKEDIIRRVRERGDIPAMKELMNVLDLPGLPSRIEGFDIAHIGGKLPVASLVSFYNGNPDKKNYRYFRLKTTDGIIDDFASMREASRRRYTRLLREKSDLPDLIVIDGGIGQVNAVNGILSELGLSIPIIGLAKRDEEIYRPNNSEPLCLPKRSDALRLLQRVRDETHRFATSRNQRLRTKQNTSVIFEKIPNVGKVRAKKLLDEFGSLDKLIAAEPEAVYSAAGCSLEQAKQILDNAKKLKTESPHTAQPARENRDKHIENLALKALGDG